MTTQAMIEKMARAHDAEDAAQRGEPDPWSIEGDDFEEFRAGRIEAMRAALQALREPTEEMVRAADALDPSNVPYSPASPDVVFTAMIDAILQEK